MSKYSLEVALAVVLVAIQVNGHGYVLKPAMRSSVWRDPQFAHLDPPLNNQDDGNYCGRILQDEPTTNCGVCGDVFSQVPPRDNEINGTYYRGIITGDYVSGQIIDIEVNITITHLGQMGFKLCTEPSDETQECFERNELRLAKGETKIPVDLKGMYINHVNLPLGVRCEHCILQWNYRAHLAGDCWDGTTLPGCGPQQTFRGCSDIRIR